MIEYGRRSLCIVDSANFIEWSILFKGHYSPFYDRLLGRLLKPGMAVVEIGANNGSETLLMAEYIGETGRVLAIEPNPRAMIRLRRNIQINGLRTVSVSPAAIGAQCGEVELVVHRDSNPTADVRTRHHDINRTEIVRVEMLTLDEVIRRSEVHQLDLLKIDTDGFELQVLLGATRTIASLRPRILFEFDPQCYAEHDSTWGAVCGLLEQANYELYGIVPNRYSLRLSRVTLSKPPPEGTDVLAIPISDGISP